MVFSLGIVPFGDSFCIDWKNRFIRYSVIRTSVSAYSVSRVLVVALSSLSAIFLGYLLTLLLFSLHMPLVSPYDVENWSWPITLFGFTEQVNPLMFLIARAFVVSLACAFWAVFALFISTVVANVFVVYVAPLVANYFLAAIPPLPDIVNIRELIRWTFIFPDAGLSLLYVTVSFLLLIAAFGYLFCRNVRRRLANG